MGKDGEIAIGAPGRSVVSLCAALVATAASQVNTPGKAGGLIV